MIKTYKEALEQIFTLEKVKDYSLEKIKLACKMLWNPQNSCKIIHITWTNWKWSVCNMVFSVLKNAWKKVWVFTSPHLLDIRERFKTEKWLISEENFIKFLNKILALPIELTYFEKCTLIAFLYFEQENCEFAIIEVWIWWLLDSTNIVKPIITAITSISFDHKNLLWDTLEEISTQKAGIIKSWAPIVYNHENEIIEKTAKEKKSQIIFTNKKVKTNLIWDFQEKNAWIAFEICKFVLSQNPLAFGIPLIKENKYESRDVWQKHLEFQIFSWLQKVEHFGRLQYLEKNLLIDWAHNEAGILELKKYLTSVSDNFEKINLCFALKKGKNIELILKEFWEKNNYFLVDLENSMLEKVEVLQNQFSGKNLEVWVLKIEEIKTKAKKNSKQLFVAFWSLYMIGGFY